MVTNTRARRSGTISLLVALAVFAGSCSGGESTFDSGVDSTDLAVGDLSEALLQAGDLEPYSEAVDIREDVVDISGDDVSGYLAICGDPLFIRPGDNPIAARSIYRLDGELEVAHTVRVFDTVDAAAVVEQTQAAADTCDAPWTEEFELASVVTELLDPLGVEPRGEHFSETQATVDSTISLDLIHNVIVQMQCGPIVSRLAMNRNAPHDAALVDDIAAAAYQRLVEAIEGAGGQCPEAAE